MSYQTVREEALAFAVRIKGLGFKVYLAKDGTYGFITDNTENRVLSFSFTDGSSLGGNYGPPTQACGTGWRMDKTPYDLNTAADVHAALYAMPPEWVGQRARGRSTWQYMTTVAQHLATYGSSSHYTEI
jgi:hypothetical protein